MQTKKQEYVWEPCINVGHEATIDVSVDEIDPYSILVELTREDLESMLSALDDLEAD